MNLTSYGLVNDLQEVTMRSILMSSVLVGAGLLCALTLGGCGGNEVAERPADEPTRTADDVVPAFTEEEAATAEEAAQNP